ncbi:unnamed protein product [Mytilus coruscus]|uniref:Uncharacterized protein n=1 Tax=Mytilus coruscus TaxID=42192 RepID=A0A6J8ES50_MYTCO|nr:unnamed protein product [Mytilus coruscus]
MKKNELSECIDVKVDKNYRPLCESDISFDEIIKALTQMSKKKVQDQTDLLLSFILNLKSFIDEIEKKCATRSVLACVPKFGIGYEVVLRERRNVRGISGDNMLIKDNSPKQCTSDDVIKVVADIHTSSKMYDDVEFNAKNGNGGDGDDDDGNEDDRDDNGVEGDCNGDDDDSIEDDVTETVENASDNGKKTQSATEITD